VVVVDGARQVANARSAEPHSLLLAVLGAGERAELAFQAGADSVVRAGAPAELLARARALRRRAEQRIEAGELSVDLATRRVSATGLELALRPIEFALLSALASDPGRVFTKRELIAAFWPDGLPAGSRALETQIVRLRRRLGPHGHLLVTVWSVGYRLDPAR
jgi:two-component system alkaline phosphatase synthesis response regulator PhoP